MMNREVYFSFENNHKINLQFGNANSFAKRYVGNNIDLKVDAFVRNVIKMVMTDHVTSACRKMGNGQLDLRKFLIEDGRIVFVEMRWPQFTNPRTGSLFSFLEDLSIIKKDK